MGAAATAKANTSFGTSLPPVPPGGTECCPLGRVRIGIFFDGTNNNAWRDWGTNFLDFKAGGENKGIADFRGPDAGTKAKEADLNGPTNVAKLYILFDDKPDNQVKVYATGVGGGDKTQTPGTMITSEAMTGAGGEARENWAIAALTDFVNRSGHELAIEKRVDTFGFSRGATQARDFINKAVAARIENKKGPVVDHRYVPTPGRGRGVVMVKEDVHPEMRGILHEFLGIMDTVASEGLGAVYQWGDAVAGYDLEVHGRPKDPKKTPEQVLKPESTPDNVIEKEGWVHQTFHQVADDEHRDVFALDMLGPDPKGWWNKFKPLPKNMREASYPGCHADVGGGYRNSPRTADAAPMFINVATITLIHMVEDGKKAGVPFLPVTTLPPILSDPNYTGGDAGVPPFMKSFEAYLSMREAWINKNWKEPKFADWTHDLHQDPVYIQSLPDGKYSDFVKVRNANADYKILTTHYVHDSAAGVYRWGADPIRRGVKTYGPMIGGFLLGGPLGAAAGYAIFGNRRDINPFSSTRQRDCHFHGFQNSY